jgi:hypothetical protein
MWVCACLVYLPSRSCSHSLARDHSTPSSVSTVKAVSLTPASLLTYYLCSYTVNAWIMSFLNSYSNEKSPFRHFKFGDWEWNIFEGLLHVSSTHENIFMKTSNVKNQVVLFFRSIDLLYVCKLSYSITSLWTYINSCAMCNH